MSNNAIVRGIFTQYYISLDVKIDDDTKKIIHKVSKYEFEKADGIKIVVIYLQTIAKEHSTYIVVCGRTHPNN